MDMFVNVLGVLQESIVKLINDRVNHLHVLPEVNSLKKNFDDNICYYLGNCSNTTTSNSSTEFECHCDHGYDGERCEKTVNFCVNVTCQNRGVCFQQFLNYTCNCLSGFNGRHCEITETSTVVRGYVTKSNFR